MLPHVALSPLVASLAPPGPRRRYMASVGLSWWAGLPLAPTIGIQLLSVSPAAAFMVAAAGAAAAGASAVPRNPPPTFQVVSVSVVEPVFNRAGLRSG